MGRSGDVARRALKGWIRKPPLYVRNFPVPDPAPIVHVEHRLAHAASAYYTSGNTGKQIIVTMDGTADGVRICLWRGECGWIEPLQKFANETSLG